MHANGAESLDPDRYVLRLDDQFGYRDQYASRPSSLRHYVNPVRHIILERFMTETTSAERPLRILSIVNLPWDGRLGATRAWIELMRAWEKQVTSWRSSVSRMHFQGPAIARRVRFSAIILPGKGCRLCSAKLQTVRCHRLPHRHAALPQAIPGFHRAFGRLVPSVCFAPTIDFCATRASSGRTSQRTLSTARLVHGFLEYRSRMDSEATLRVCDLISVPNKDERLELTQDESLRVPIMVEPYGLADDFRKALSEAAATAPERLANQTICFIGMWSLRKGSRDWTKIISTIRRQYPGTKFLLLGTMVPDEVVLADVETREGISCQRNFSERELPSVLSRCTLALFPSYIEGFGLAILEQLAAGLPTVAYDVSGPGQILAPLRDQLLVPQVILPHSGRGSLRHPPVNRRRV